MLHLCEKEQLQLIKLLHWLTL